MSFRPAFVFHPDYEMNIGKHVFPTQKFRLIKERLIYEGALTEGELLEAPKASEAELLAVLEKDYLKDLRSYRHTSRTSRSELPICESIVEGCATTAGGTLLAVEKAMHCGGACHIGGGFHHGFGDHAEGFCYINDVAVAAANAKARGWARRIAVIDTDVHQGNGTARIFSSDPDVFTFSIHQERLYPFVKEASDLDIGMPLFAGDEAYLDALTQAVERVLKEHRPELVLYVAGVDPYRNDVLGSLGISYEGMVRREQIVLGAAIAAHVPFVTITGGGYARDVTETVALHAETIMTAIELSA